MQHSHPTLIFKPLILFPPISYRPSLHPHPRHMLLAVSLYLLLPLPLSNSLRVFQWNAGGLQAWSTKLLHFILCHPVDLIYIQESNRNLCSSFQIPGFSALRSHGTHSRFGIFSTDVADASGGVIIFVKQGLSFSELSTFSLSSPDPYSDYVGVNISLNNFSSLSFLNVYAPPIRSFRRIAEPISFLSPFFSSMRKRIFRASASASTEKVPLPLPHPCCSVPTYIGVKLNSMFTFRHHLEASRKKLSTRVMLLRRLAGSGWDAVAKTLNIFSLSLVYSTAQNCTPVCCRGTHKLLMDSILSNALLIVAGCLCPTPTEELPILASMQPAELHRLGATFF